MSVVLKNKLFSADDLAAFDDDERFELIDGILIPMAPPLGFHGADTGSLATYVGAHILYNNLGIVYAAETGFLVSRNPDTVLAPDFAYIKRSRIENHRPLSYIEIAPDLTIETRSVGDTNRGVSTKISRWLKFGVLSVWDLDPKRFVLTIHKHDALTITLTLSDAIVDEEILPGFSLPLKKVFDYDVS